MKHLKLLKRYYSTKTKYLTISMFIELSKIKAEKIKRELSKIKNDIIPFAN